MASRRNSAEVRHFGTASHISTNKLERRISHPSRMIDVQQAPSVHDFSRKISIGSPVTSVSTAWPELKDGRQKSRWRRTSIGGQSVSSLGENSSRSSRFSIDTDGRVSLLGSMMQKTRRSSRDSVLDVVKRVVLKSKTERKRRWSRYMRMAKDQETPIEKFRRVARTVHIITSICLALKCYIKKNESNEWSLVEMQLNLQADFNRLLAFNPQSYSKGPSQRSGEKLKRILACPFHERTADHIQVMMALLRGNDSFEDYPVHTQVQLCRCMIYQSYEARRIVIKEGHPPSAFYIILSGTVLINMRETHPKTGHTFVRTVHQMTRGEAFGEIALMNGTNRTSTIVCKTDVELLVIMKEDFDVIIKEPLEKQRDMHIDYCRDMELFKDFPCDVFRTALTQFFYQYFKVGMTVVQDSRQSNYVVVVKSGTCKVVTNFREMTGKGRKRNNNVFSHENDLKEMFPLHSDRLRREKQAQRSKRNLVLETGEMRDVMRANLIIGETDHNKIVEVPKAHKPIEIKRPKKQLRRSSTLTHLYDYLEKERKENEDGVLVSEGGGFWSKHLGSHGKDRFGKTPDQIAEEERKVTKAGFGRTWKRVMAGASAANHIKTQQSAREKSGKLCYAQVAELHAGSVFGLENMLHKSTKSFSLVSGGAECILISKKLFLKEANAKVLRVVSDLVISYPSQKYVKQEIHSQRNWEKYKSGLVKEIQSKSKP